jgi:hypothetical protein
MESDSRVQYDVLCQSSPWSVVERKTSSPNLEQLNLSFQYSISVSIIVRISFHQHQHTPLAQAFSNTFTNNSSSDCHHALQHSLQLPSPLSFHFFNACTILVLLTCPSPSHVSTRILTMFYSHEGKPSVLNFQCFSNWIAHSSYLVQARRSDSLVNKSHFTSTKNAPLTTSPRLVATLGSKSTLKKVDRKEICAVNIPKACQTIISPEAPMALRLQSNLL